MNRYRIGDVAVGMAVMNTAESSSMTSDVGKIDLDLMRTTPQVRKIMRIQNQPDIVGSQTSFIGTKNESYELRLVKFWIRS